ncbi:MAG TPA: hypothetical protein VKT27_05925 [Candidatus Binataceae bacterium]|nr:hypothetical protein [Candidatus Binataceae bacterium]
MKFDGKARLCSGLLVALAAACAFVLMLMAADSASAQEAEASGSSMTVANGSGGSADSSWERAESVLEVPRVYRADGSDQPDTCAEDCPNPNSANPGDPARAPIAVAGTADDPTAQSAAVNGTPSENAEPSQNAASGVDDQAPDNTNPNIAGAGQDSLDSAVGTARDYQEQQRMAEQLGNAGTVAVAPIFIPVPASPYYLPGSAASASAPPRSIGSPSVLMPPPIPRIAPLPSIVPRGFSPGVGAFAGSSAAGSGGFVPGFAPMMGFHGAFGGFHGGFGHR